MKALLKAEATLSFHSRLISDDSTKAVIPEISDFQFWSWNPQKGEQTQLQFADNTIEVKGKKLIFDLATKVPSGVHVDVTYDPIISTFADSSSNNEPFTNVNVQQAAAFIGIPSRTFHQTRKDLPCVGPTFTEIPLHGP